RPRPCRRGRHRPARGRGPAAADRSCRRGRRGAGDHRPGAALPRGRTAPMTEPAATAHPEGTGAEPAPAARDLASPEAAERARAALHALRAEVGKAVVGQEQAVSGLVVALLAQGHVLLEGVPGTAKTLLVRALAAALDVRTTRVQFTPD